MSYIFPKHSFSFRVHYNLTAKMSSISIIIFACQIILLIGISSGFKGPSSVTAKGSSLKIGGNKTANAPGKSNNTKPNHVIPPTPLIDDDSYEYYDEWYEDDPKGKPLGRALGAGKIEKKRNTGLDSGPGIQGRAFGLDDKAGKDGYAGIDPVMGPYPRFDASNSDPSDSAGKKRIFRSWNEYLEASRLAILGDSDNRKTTGYVPVMSPDHHFRYMDNLYKKKNERVKLFHDLYLYMKNQGKKFEFAPK